MNLINKKNANLDPWAIKVFDHHLLPLWESDFKYSRNQASNSSINSKEHRSSEKVIRSSVPIQSSLSLRLSFAIKEISGAPAFLAPASACHQTGNDCKHHTFFQLLSWFRSGTRFSSIFGNSICFQIFVKDFASCCLPMAITIARFIGVRHTNIHRKTWGRCLHIWCSKFLEFSFQILVKNSKYSVPSKSIQLRIPAAFVNIDKAYLLNHWSYEGAWIPIRKRWKSSITLLFNLCQNFTTIAPVLYFLTAARGQVRFDLSTRSDIFRCCRQSRTLSLSMMLQKCTTISVLSSQLKSRRQDLVNWHHKVSLPPDDVDPHIGSPSATTCLMCQSLSSTLGPRKVVKIFIPWWDKTLYVRFCLSLIKNCQPYPADLHRHATIGSLLLQPTKLSLVDNLVSTISFVLPWFITWHAFLSLPSRWLH
jgi:hypothetical protein